MVLKKRKRKLRVSQAQIDEHFEAKGIKKQDQLCYLDLKCCKCGKVMSIHVNNKELYTPEVKAKWTCIFCKKF